MYVGRIPPQFTRRELRQKFERFGVITDTSVHFREHGDNYGFVTFLYRCDVHTAIDSEYRYMCSHKERVTITYHVYVTINVLLLSCAILSIQKVKQIQDWMI